MKFKVYKHIIFIDTFSDREIVEYIADELKSKLNWEVFCVDEDLPELKTGKFFDNIPRYYGLYFRLKKMAWSMLAPTDQYRNSITSKKQAKELIEFTVKYQETLVEQEDFPYCILTNIHENPKYIKFFQRTLPYLKEWKFSKYDEENINKWIQKLEPCPPYLAFELQWKTIRSYPFIPKFPAGTKVVRYNITDEASLHILLEKITDYSNELDKLK